MLKQPYKPGDIVKYYDFYVKDQEYEDGFAGMVAFCHFLRAIGLETVFLLQIAGFMFRMREKNNE